MNVYLLAAGVLMILVGAIHSLLGEKLIFTRLRRGSFLPGAAEPWLLHRHVRILWASWHVLSLFGWAFAAIVIRLAYAPAPLPLQPFILNSMIVALVLSAALVLVATRGRHPGWIGLLGAALLTALS